LEAQERAMDRLESKMTASTKLLADKDSCLRKLEVSLLDNTHVCFTTHKG